jgi:hypothetical protein
MHSMTVTYADGVSLEALVLSADGGMLRVALAGENDVRIFTRRADGRWLGDNGRLVKLSVRAEKDSGTLAPEESHFSCSKELGREVISSLLNGPEMNAGGRRTFYVFAAEKRRVNITVLRG